MAGRPDGSSAAARRTPDGALFPRLDEIPFDTERKRMSVICATPQGHMLYCKGAPESVLPLCSEMLLQGKCLPLDGI